MMRVFRLHRISSILGGGTFKRWLNTHHPTLISYHSLTFFCSPQIPLLPEGKLQDRMPPSPTGPPTETCLLSIIVPNNKHCMQSCIQLLGIKIPNPYTPENYQENEKGKPTIWRCISYQKWWFSIAILIFGRVNLFDHNLAEIGDVKPPQWWGPQHFFPGTRSWKISGFRNDLNSSTHFETPKQSPRKVDENPSGENPERGEIRQVGAKKNTHSSRFRSW